jgi:hypothetical protein
MDCMRWIPVAHYLIGNTAVQLQQPRCCVHDSQHNTADPGFEVKP